MTIQYLYSSVVLMTNSALLTVDAVAAQVPAVQFVHRNLNVFAFKLFHLRCESVNFHLTSCFASQSFLAQIDKMANDCNYTSYLKKFLAYPPPPAPFPLPGTSEVFDPGCNVFGLIAEAALLLNPAFDVYRIFDMVCYCFTFLFLLLTIL